jgi:hypothetical protein
MSDTGNDPAFPYRLSISGSIADEIRMLTKQSAIIGNRNLFLDAMLAIEKRLCENLTSLVNAVTVHRPGGGDVMWVRFNQPL